MEAYAGMHVVKQCVKLDAMKLTVIVVVTVIGPQEQHVETVMEVYVGIIVAKVNVLLEVVLVENNKKKTYLIWFILTNFSNKNYIVKDNHFREIVLKIFVFFLNNSGSKTFHQDVFVNL